LSNGGNRALHDPDARASLGEINWYGKELLTDEQWARLAPLIEQVRPRASTPYGDLRQTIAAIVWRHRNGATWRSIPAELGPWWRAAQTFIHWARLGIWERLLDLAQQRGIALGMTFCQYQLNFPQRGECRKPGSAAFCVDRDGVGPMLGKAGVGSH
jgi:transposase